ncbi:hypothetical protein F4859DRAFT_357170 [Xylaria cf. heliscus]|nr:hypothetical protein F4859DRAFT_357170 [Xylaria cf. heliscus]
MSGLRPFIRGLTNPRAGLQMLWETAINGQAGLVVEGAQDLVPAENFEITLPNILGAVINWLFFGPLLYLVAAPVYYVYCLIYSIVDELLYTWAVVRYAITQTFFLLQRAFGIFFLTGFALQAIRVVLLVLGVPGGAYSIKFLEDGLNIFFSLFAVLVRMPRWDRQRPGRHNGLWIQAALISIYIIFRDTAGWSPAWRLITFHFAIYVAFAGPTPWENVEVRNPDFREVYQRQALLIISLLGLSLAISQTENWSLLYRFVTIVAAAITVMAVLEFNSHSQAQIIYREHPEYDVTLGMPPTFGLYVWLVGTIAVPILLSSMIAHWAWYFKWPLLISLAFVAFLFRGAYTILAGAGDYPVIRPVSRRRVQLQEPQDNNNSGDDIDQFGRPHLPGGRRGERLPDLVENMGGSPTSIEQEVRFWYRYYVEPVVWRTRNLNRRQRQLVGDRILRLITGRDLRASYDDIDLIYQYIEMAVEYEKVEVRMTRALLVSGYDYFL